MNIQALMQYAQMLRGLQGYQPGAADRNRGMFLRPQTPDMPMTSWAQNIPDAQAQMPRINDDWANDYRSQLANLGYAGWARKQGVTPSGPPSGFTGSVTGWGGGAESGPGRAYNVPSNYTTGQTWWPIEEAGSGKFYKGASWTPNARSTPAPGGLTFDSDEATRMRNFLSGLV